MTATDQENRSSLGLTPLINGIIEDAQVLIRQQLALFQSEIKSDLTRGKEAAIPLGLGLAATLLAGFVGCMALVHLTVWLWPEIPMFAAYGAICVIVGLAGATLIVVGKNRLDAVNLGDKSVEGLKETVQWAKKN